MTDVLSRLETLNVRISETLDRVEKAIKRPGPRVPGDGDGDGIPNEGGKKKLSVNARVAADAKAKRDAWLETRVGIKLPESRREFDQRVERLSQKLNEVPQDLQGKNHALVSRGLESARNAKRQWEMTHRLVATEQLAQSRFKSGKFYG